MRDGKMIKKIAWSFHYTTGLDFQELWSEGIMAYFSAMKAYNKTKKTKLSSFAYIIIQRHLINFCQQEKNHKNGLEPVEDTFQELSYTPEYEFFRKEIPADIAEILTEILGNKEDYSRLNPKKVRGKLINSLRDKGWSWEQIWRTLNFCKNNLNEIEKFCII